MKIERTEFGFQVTGPFIAEDEIKIINNDFDNMINKFLNMIIHDKDLERAQYIIKKQQEQINELKRNSIPKKKIEYKIKELESMINNSIEGEIQKYTPGEMFLLIHFLEELLEGK